MANPLLTRRTALKVLAAAGIGAMSPGVTFANQTAAATRLATEPAMLTKPIPSSGEALPVIGLGTWQTFDVGPGEDQRGPLEQVLAEFVRLGGRVIDSSPMYGRSESVVGELSDKLKLRDQLFVATKVWTRGRDEGVRQMNDSLDKLRVGNSIDLMQVHNLVDVEAHLETLRAWTRDRRVRYVGITHYTASQHDAVARVVERHAGEGLIDFVQINYSVGERDAERRLLPMLAERKVAVIANRPFGGGGLLSRLRGKPLPDVAREIGCSSWAQLLLKFVVSHPAVTCAIPGTSKVQHLRDNMAAGTGAMPDEAMRARIAEAAV